MPDIFGGNVTVTVKDSNGTRTANDSVSMLFTNMLKEMSPIKRAEGNLINTCRKATLYSDEAFLANMYIRIYKVDYKVDSAISKKGRTYFNQAEEKFGQNNFNEAVKYYQKALEADTGYYKAQLYLGDCYYRLGEYILAIEALKKAKAKAPNIIEPRKYLTDAYYKEKLYEKALEEAIETMWLYPDLSMVAKLYDAAYINGKKLKWEWVPRNVYPNTYSSTDVIVYKEKKKTESPESNSWAIYKAALEKAKPYCDKNGIFQVENTLTKSRYLEVYSWEEMLKSAPVDQFQFARKMQDKGYLDCYIMITCFHYDFYQQYKDFVEKNQERIRAYIKLCLEDK